MARLSTPGMRPLTKRRVIVAITTSASAWLGELSVSPQLRIDCVSEWPRETLAIFTHTWLPCVRARPPSEGEQGTVARGEGGRARAVVVVLGAVALRAHGARTAVASGSKSTFVPTTALERVGSAEKYAAVMHAVRALVMPPSRCSLAIALSWVSDTIACM